MQCVPVWWTLVSIYNIIRDTSGLFMSFTQVNLLAKTDISSPLYKPKVVTNKFNKLNTKHIKSKYGGSSFIRVIKFKDVHIQS